MYRTQVFLTAYVTLHYALLLPLWWWIINSSFLYISVSPAGYCFTHSIISCHIRQKSYNYEMTLRLKSHNYKQNILISMFYDFLSHNYDFYKPHIYYFYLIIMILYVILLTCHNYDSSHNLDFTFYHNYGLVCPNFEFLPSNWLFIS